MTFERTSYRLIGNVGLGIGVLLVLLSILTLFVNFKIVVWQFPNVPYTIIVAVVGIILIAVGSVFRIEGKRQTPPPPSRTLPLSQIFCRYCGAENTLDEVFCSKCGKKLA